MGSAMSSSPESSVSTASRHRGLKLARKRKPRLLMASVRSTTPLVSVSPRRKKPSVDPGQGSLSRTPQPQAPGSILPVSSGQPSQASPTPSVSLSS